MLRLAQPDMDVAVREFGRLAWHGLEAHYIMHYVYVIESQSHPGQRYIGYTAKRMDLRLESHNNGTTPATARYRPWRLVWVGAFLDKYMALLL